MITCYGQPANVALSLLQQESKQHNMLSRTQLSPKLIILTEKLIKPNTLPRL